jgi:GAF domain-containing protein
MTDDTVTAIGRLPEGKGLLGGLLDDPTPSRLKNIAAHESSVRFPDHHPPMKSCLGVRIRSGHPIFGNLFHTDRKGADHFSRDDEELVGAFAAARAAISNATAVAPSRRRPQRQAATGLLSTAS